MTFKGATLVDLDARGLRSILDVMIRGHKEGWKFVSSVPKLTLLIGLLLALSGCFDQERIYTINPDGSAKVVFRMSSSLPKEVVEVMNQLGDGPGRKQFDSKFVSGFASGLMSGLRGAEIWKDVTCQMEGTGRWRFEGTAYIRDLENISETDDSGRGAADLIGDLEGISVSQAASGELEFTLFSAPERESERKTSGRALDAAASKAELDSAMSKVAEWLNELSSARFSTTYQFPGATVDQKGMSLTGDRLSLSFDGDAIKKAFETSFAAFRQDIDRGVDPETKSRLNYSVYRVLLGTNLNRKISVKPPFRTQFNYRDETAAARKSYPQMLARLGITDPKLVALGEPLVLPSIPRRFTNSVDLGISTFRSGTKGDRYGAEIRSVSQLNGVGSLVLKLEVPKDELLFLSVYDEDGHSIDGRVTSCSSLGRATIVSYRAQSELPQRGSIRILVK